jgi:hypothetical protein
MARADNVVTLAQAKVMFDRIGVACVTLRKVKADNAGVRRSITRSHQERAHALNEEGPTFSIQRHNVVKRLRLAVLWSIFLEVGLRATERTRFAILPASTAHLA